MRVQERSVTDIVMAIVKMNEQVLHFKGHTDPANYKTVKHYIGMNYDLHVEELMNRGYKTIAKKYQDLKEKW